MSERKPLRLWLGVAFLTALLFYVLSFGPMTYLLLLLPQQSKFTEVVARAYRFVYRPHHDAAERPQVLLQLSSLVGDLGDFRGIRDDVGAMAILSKRNCRIALNFDGRFLKKVYRRLANGRDRCASFCTNSPTRSNTASLPSPRRMTWRLNAIIASSFSSERMQSSAS